MTDKPTLKSASVTLRYTTGGGSSVEFNTKSGQQPRPASPIRALAAAVDEIARIAEIAGEGEMISDAVAAAVRRVKEWRSEQLAEQRRLAGTA